MKYGLLEEGDEFQKGDEMFSSITYEWSPIPEQWLSKGFKFSHEQENTFSRHKIQVRRKLQSNENSNQQPTKLQTAICSKCEGCSFEGNCALLRCISNCDCFDPK